MRHGGRCEGPQYLSGVPLLSHPADHIAAIAYDVAEPHRRQPVLATRVHLPGGPAGAAAQMQPVQGGAAACLEVRLVPHAGTFRQTGGKRNPSRR